MKRAVALITAFAVAALLSAQSQDSRGIVKVVQQLAGQSAAVGRQYAVLIAVDRYRSWTALRNPVEDARRIKDVLARRYYVDEFIELYDEAATKAGIIRLFGSLIERTKPEDGVFIFYAGHGHLDSLSDTGFWIPADGGLDRYEQLNWLPNTQVRGLIRGMKARHVVLMADSCFSGDILNPTRAIQPEITSSYFRRAYTGVSRQVLTSGSSEAVPDQSDFARGLETALEGNTSPYLDPLALYNEIRRGTRETTPLFGELADCGHQEGASFLFFLKDQAGGTAEETAAPSRPRLTVRKPMGSVSVLTREPGTLSLDGVPFGDIPADAPATLDAVEAGTHILAMTFTRGGTEKRRIVVAKGVSLSVVFAEALPVGAPIPSASIRIDGSFDDWKDVRPLFVDPAGDAVLLGKSGDMVRVFAAEDADWLYMAFEIADTTEVSFFHPHNFDTTRDNSYSLLIDPGPRQISLTVGYDAARVHGFAAASRLDGGWTQICEGQYAKKGSWAEARFPLRPLREYLEAGSTHVVLAIINALTGKKGDPWDGWNAADTAGPRTLQMGPSPRP
jgi:hypothetical protein